MIKQISICMIILCGLAFAMEEDEAKRAARQKAMDELTELQPNPFKRTCGSHLFACLFQFGNIAAAAHQLKTSTIYYDLLSLEAQVKNPQEYINGTPFISAFIANSDQDALMREIIGQFKQRPGFYFLRGFISLDGTPVFAAGVSAKITHINLRKIADKLKEHSKRHNLALSCFANNEGSFLKGQLPSEIDQYDDTKLKMTLKQWLSEK